MAGDLLPKFVISTKVGYFRDGHSLNPARLRKAVETAAADLGRDPDTVLLHNPEHSAPDTEALLQACGVLADAAARGQCGSWGIATWDPRPLVGLDVPRPDILMVRSGLLVSSSVLEAAEALVTTWRPTEVRGMSPFGGSTTDPVWGRVDARMFLAAPDATLVQAAFRVAFALPDVTAVAVGTDDAEHLRELCGGLDHDLDTDVLRAYRLLLSQSV
ncbi:aryl-alcohol dehydrogenase-like predicted oxidoreductase [Kitasatospora viridis]|uniref:Aryl-alcohol dehydrogenase-like predicted oxidoreductase n=2 Tax=Kitasatospora viridis TaxID=281105 RepID=A0A561UN56_9ACTN|nr:aryl-alcohol dehydrogenase-like predicted oxidoreductase [Kitasatospora viridis]